MIRTLSIISLVMIVACNRRESDYEKLQKTMEETRRDMRTVNFSAKLTTRNLPEIKDDAELKSICQAIMEKAGQGDLRSAFDEIAKYSVLPKSEVDTAYTASKRQMDLVGNRFGKFIGYEYVGSQQLSDSLIKYIYIAKCENHALPWHFVFYKPKDKWTLNNFSWNDSLQDIRF